jgi:predicted NBD/HSP70 family sugar kinase
MKRSMDHFVGLDVSVKETSVCIVDDTGKIVREVKVASEPEVLYEAAQSMQAVQPVPLGGGGVEITGRYINDTSHAANKRPKRSNRSARPSSSVAMKSSAASQE